MSMIIRFIAVSIASGTPILFGTLGEILNEKVGHLNLGVEGMMAIGACAGFMVGYSTDNFLLALIAAFAAGALAALIYIYGKSKCNRLNAYHLWCRSCKLLGISCP